MGIAKRTKATKGPAETMNPFICVGDSITIGFPSGFGGYRSKLKVLAPAMFFTGRNENTGLHEGYNGFRTDQVSPLVLPLIPILQPRCILMTMGVNDINQGQSCASTLVEVHAFADACLAASDAAGGGYLKYVFVSTIPIGATLFALGGDAFNTGMAAEFAGADARIILVDACTGLVRPTDFDDGLHPNDTTGYPKMAAAWYPALQAKFPSL